MLENKAWRYCYGNWEYVGGMCQQEKLTTALHMQSCKGRARSITWIKAMCNQEIILYWEDKKPESNSNDFYK